MMSSISDNVRPVLAVRPAKFALWLFLFSIVMFFAALTSAYLVKRADGDWIAVQLPSAFLYTSILIVLSSVSMHLAYRAGKQHAPTRLQPFVLLTLLLGIGFILGQYQGWKALVATHVYVVGHPAGSFIYVLSGAHAVHVLGGLVFLLSVYIAARRHRIHPESMQALEMCTVYWHFLGGLWLYLYSFFLIYN